MIQTRVVLFGSYEMVSVEFECRRAYLACKVKSVCRM